MEYEDINKQIGNKLRHIRKRRGLSLEETAARTGVSKPMLGQIERGISNPTVGTLWKIANGLHVAFSTFIESERPDVQYIDYDRLEVLQGEQGTFHVKPVIPKNTETPFEVYYIELDAQDEYFSQAHPEGVEEYLFLTEGELEVHIKGRSYVLKTGDALRFKANHDHTYRNKSNHMARCTMIIYYSSS